MSLLIVHCLCMANLCACTRTRTPASMASSVIVCACPLPISHTHKICCSPAIDGMMAAFTAVLLISFMATNCPLVYGQSTQGKLQESYIAS